jgi:hypothetical protein
VLSVNVGTTAGFAGGIVLISTGSLAIFVGLIVLLVAATENSVPTYNSSTNSFQQGDSGNTGTVGGVITLAGVAGLVTGIVLTVGNKRTKATQDVALPAPPGAAPQDAWLRTPTWREDRTNVALPRPGGFPVFQTTF